MGTDRHLWYAVCSAAMWGIAPVPNHIHHVGKNHISSESNNNKKEDTFICEFDHQNWVKTKGMIFVHIIGEVHISICNMTDTMRTLIGLKTFFFPSVIPQSLQLMSYKPFSCSTNLSRLLHQEKVQFIA